MEPAQAKRPRIEGIRIGKRQRYRDSAKVQTLLVWTKTNQRALMNRPPGGLHTRAAERTDHSWEKLPALNTERAALYDQFQGAKPKQTT